jgi:hypothetical protein
MAQAYLENGAIYRGRIMIHHSAAVLSVGGGSSRVKSELEKFGFTNIKVWMDSDELPNNWPESKKEDISGWGETQVWLEGTWGKPSNQFATSTSDFHVIDYWIQKPAPQVVSPQPDTVTPDYSTPDQSTPVDQNIPVNSNCLQNGLVCSRNTACCSGYCVNGKCADYKSNLDCVGENVSCDDAMCCKGLLCQHDQTIGGPICKKDQNVILDQEKTKKPISPWWVVLGGVVAGAAVIGVGIKVFSSSNKSSS